MTRGGLVAGVRSATFWSLAALGVGLAIGAAGHGSRSAGFAVLGEVVAPLGELWLAALQMTVLPLVVVYLLAAIIGAHGSDSLGGLGSRAVALFVAMLVAAAAFTLLVVPMLIDAAAPAPGAMAALHAATTVPQAARDAATGGTGSLGQWIGRLLPSNLFESARRGDVLPLLLFSVLLALAIRRLPDDQRRPLERGFEALSAAMLIIVRWLLVVTPVGVFALSYALGRDTGIEAAGVLGGLVLLQCGVMVSFTLLLYPASAMLGRVSIGAFARAVAPAQFIAASTRSSLAALPALVEGARTRLQLPAAATSFVLPLTVSLFKVNRTISSTAKLLFLAHVYGVALSSGTIATFVVTVIVLSFSSIGVPGGGSAFKTLPAYLAAGVPIEGIIIAEAVETIPDIFKTVLNVTGDMSAATLLSRGSRAPALAATALPPTERAA
jgi:proton glutamate symport protein